MDIERLIAEARDPQTDHNDFCRYFLNQPVERTQDKWISQERWDEGYEQDVTVPAGAIVVVGADGAQTRDTTAIGWAHRRADNKIVVGCRVWTVRPETEVRAHVYVPGARLDNDDARDYVSGTLMRRYAARQLFYDTRYFYEQAKDLSDDAGMTVVELEQGSRQMKDAWNDFYRAVVEGEIVHDGDPVLAAHVDAAAGQKMEWGWKVSKLKSTTPIDGLAAVVMAHFGVVRVPPPAPVIAYSW